jgi:MFS family permease
MLSKTAIEKYFNAEKAESLLFMAIGLTGIILAVVFFFILKTELHKGMALPLTAVGLILAITGLTVYRRSDRQRIGMVNALESNPQQLKQEELPRMKRVMRSFVFFRWIEIILFLTGAGIYLYFIRDFRHDFWRGFGFALTIMALLALAADYFAEKRGKIYTRMLEDVAGRI